mmetsp:Transcript_9391/g.13927  ORF Transcript_9391/g.13927 Transcript_9391/m.13927 type:complete len:109 (-) Transcript_9391:338-664(-)
MWFREKLLFWRSRSSIFSTMHRFEYVYHVPYLPFMSNCYGSYGKTAYKGAWNSSVLWLSEDGDLAFLNGVKVIMGGTYIFWFRNWSNLPGALAFFQRMVQYFEALSLG